jgi:hypothetical protein
MVRAARLLPADTARGDALGVQPPSRRVQCSYEVERP